MFRIKACTIGINMARKYSTMTSSQQLLSAVSDLEKFGIKLKNFPTMVLIGPQSSGKSSLIQSIIGDYILPVSMKTATKKPMHITTLKSDHKQFKIGDRTFVDAKDASQEIERLNRNDYVKQVNISIHSPDVYNSILIDLPGLFSITDDGQDDTFRKRIKEMAAEYASNTNYVPIIVHAAPSDPANNAGIKLITKIGRRDNTLGVLTKLDMVKDQRKEYLEKMLGGKEYKLGHGYCAVVLPNDTDIDNGISVQQKIQYETDFFKKYPNIKPAGVPTLCKIISDIQSREIMTHIPAILHDVNIHIASFRDSENFLNKLLSGDNRMLCINLRSMIEKLVGSSYDRAVFEGILRERFKKEITSFLDKTYSGINSDTCLELPKSMSRVPREIVTLSFSSNMENNNNIIDKQNSFRKLFSYGMGSPIFIDNKIINDHYQKELHLASCLHLFEPMINDNLGNQRTQWNKNLHEYFAALLENDNIHHIIKKITFSELGKYICSSRDFADPSSKKFAEYMINEIGNEAFESHIKYSITAMLNIEKRPQVSIFDIIRHLPDLTDSVMNTKSFIFIPIVHKRTLEIFSEAWNRAYISAVVDNIIENCYRNVAVNFIDKMVEKLLEMTIDMFHKAQATIEKNKVDEKLKKLTEIKTILENNMQYLPDKSSNSQSEQS